ncbi:diguanylate cyclase, partial [Candidatus Zixiibacteriota bacterium]
MDSFLEKLVKELGHSDDSGIESRTTSQRELERNWHNWRWWANRFYRLVCFGAGMIFLEIYLLNLDFTTARAAFFLALINLGAALHAITFPTAWRLSFHFILTYANLLLFGPGIAALSSGVGAFGHYLVIRKRPLSVAMFQMGRYILAAVGAGFVFTTLGGKWGWPNLSWPMVVFSGATYLIISFGLEVLPYAWLRGLSVPAVRRAFIRRTLTYIIFVPTSISIFYIYFPYGADGVLLFLVPVATFALALELYARSTITSRNLNAIQEISRRVSTILDADRLMGEALELTRGVINFDWGVVWLKNHRTGKYEARHSITTTGQERPIPTEMPRSVEMATQTGRIVEAPAPLVSKQSLFDESTAPSILAVPLSSRGDVLGVLSLATSVTGGFNSRERNLLQTLANNAATAVQNAQLFKQRESEAIRDGLTRLYNHRFLQERLAQEEERARRYGRLFSVIILDIDHFKIYNDSFGHPAGDQLLI